MDFEFDTKASPEQALRALTDFSDRRLEIWSRTLDPKRYEVRERGETWAVAREASPGSPFWVVLRYDWSDPTEVRWTVVESSYRGGGTGVARIASREGGGARLHVAYDATDARGVQRPLLFVLYRLPLDRFIARSWSSALDRYAESEDGRAAR